MKLDRWGEVVRRSIGSNFLETKKSPPKGGLYKHINI